MRFFRRVAGFLGLAGDNGSEVKDSDDDTNQTNNHRPHNVQETGLPRKGFGVQVQVAVERPLPGPIIVPCTSGRGGVQDDLISNAYPSSAQKGFENPQETIVRIVCANCDLANKPVDIEGLRWYAKLLRIDNDGDVADEFFEEVFLQTLAREEEQNRSLPKFKLRYSTRPVEVKNQFMTPDGKIQQCVEYHGRLQWV